MAKENVQKDEERLEQIESTLGKTEMFIEKNRNTIMVFLGIIIVVVLAIFGVKKFIFEPREAEAQTAIFHAEQLFENDDYATALNGDGNNAGFMDIINEYGGRFMWMNFQMPRRCMSIIPSLSRICLGL